jgi:hypothetical protein
VVGNIAELEPPRDSMQPHVLLLDGYAPRESQVALSFLIASAAAFSSAMPFGHHHQNAQNDPAQGIYAAASALGSM